MSRANATIVAITHSAIPAAGLARPGVAHGTIADRPARLRGMLDVAEGVLEALRCAAIVVDDAGRVQGATQRGAMLLERGDGLRLERGYLRAENPRDTAKLRCLLRRATDPAYRGGGLAISRAGHRLALVVSASPLPRLVSCPPRLHAPTAVVLVSDPEALPPPIEPVLRQLYGLTAAEARIASRIAQGESIARIAAALGVRRTTVRTQLRQAFAKTGTHRQAELVRLVLMAAPLVAATDTAPRPAGSIAATASPID